MKNQRQIVGDQKLRNSHHDQLSPYIQVFNHQNLISSHYHSISNSFLGENETFLVIISSKLNAHQEGNDTIQAMSNSDFDVKCATIQFYGNSYNFQSDRWIGPKFYVESPDMLAYLDLKFQVNQIFGRHHNTGQQRLYEFCYLLPFDLWTSYLARILFLKGCGSLFWEYPNSTRIFNVLQYSFPSVARIH